MGSGESFFFVWFAFFVDIINFYEDIFKNSLLANGFEGNSFFLGGSRVCFGGFGLGSTLVYQ